MYLFIHTSVYLYIYYFLTYGLFTNAVSSSVYIAVNHAISEQWTATDVEESHGLTECTILASAWRDYGTPHKNLCQDSWCPNQESNWVPYKCKSQALLLSLPAWFEFPKIFHYTVYVVTVHHFSNNKKF